MALSPKKQAFAIEYVKNGFNADKAWIAAGYKPNNGSAWHMRRDPEVAAYIKARLDAEAMEADEVLSGIRRIATASLRDSFRTDFGQPTMDLAQLFETGAIDFVKKISKGPKGITVEMYDKLGALNSLAKAHGLHDRSVIDELVKARTGAGEVTDELVLAYAEQIIARRARAASGEGSTGLEQDDPEPDPADGPLDTD